MAEIARQRERRSIHDKTDTANYQIQQLETTMSNITDGGNGHPKPAWVSSFKSDEIKAYGRTRPELFTLISAICCFTLDIEKEKFTLVNKRTAEKASEKIHVVSKES